tara:strand:+ start:170 stop:421 length:252 start_codon:yes stop_codon:yes gene_type:complete
MLLVVMVVLTATVLVQVQQEGLIRATVLVVGLVVLTGQQVVLVLLLLSTLQLLRVQLQVALLRQVVIIRSTNLLPLAHLRLIK